MKGDARAVENPITAIFDLAEEVEAQAPKIRRLLRYSRAFVSVWLLLDALFILIFAENKALALVLLPALFLLLLATRFVHVPSLRVGLFGLAGVVGALLALSFGPTVLLGLVLVVLFYLGMVILALMRDIRAFFRYFEFRHRVVRSVRDADPVVYIPPGTNHVQRLLNHLAAASPDIARLAAARGGVATPALLQGKSGLTYSFDAYLHTPPSALWKVFGIGVAGFAVYVKAFDHAPTREDLGALKRAVEDVSAATRIPPARVIALWSAPEEGEVKEDAYAFLTTEVVRMDHRGTAYACSLELITETPDGTYDFIPLVVEGAGPSAG
jgi:hypothetical protein